MSTNKSKIKQLRADNPELKAVDIAKELSISAEAVRQHLNNLGLPTKIRKIPENHKFCPCCGREY